MDYRDFLALLAESGIGPDELRGVLGHELFGLILPYMNAPRMRFPQNLWALIRATVRYFIAKRTWMALQAFKDKGQRDEDIDPLLPHAINGVHSEFNELKRCADQTGVIDLLPAANPHPDPIAEPVFSGDNAP